MSEDLLRGRLLRRIIIDMLPFSVENEDILAMQDRLGLVPSSLDTLELERRESNARIKSMKPIGEILTQLSAYSAEAIAEYTLMQVKFDDDDDDDSGISMDQLRSALVRQNANIIVTAAHGIVSHLIASGVLVFKE